MGSPFGPEPATERRPWTLLWDGDCGFCAWTVLQLRGLEARGRLTALPLQQVDDLHEEHALRLVARSHRLWEAVHLVSPTGEVTRAGAAMLGVARLLPGARLLGPWLRAPWTRPLAEALYRLVARHRGGLGRLVDPSGKARAELGCTPARRGG